MVTQLIPRYPGAIPTAKVREFDVVWKVVTLDLVILVLLHASGLVILQYCITSHLSG